MLIYCKYLEKMSLECSSGVEVMFHFQFQHAHFLFFSILCPLISLRLGFRRHFLSVSLRYRQKYVHMTPRSLISTFPTLHKLAKLFWPITTRVSSENIIFLPLFRFPVSLMYSLRGVLCTIVQALLYQSTIIDG